jgi:serine/threonine-protein kinase
MDATNRVVAGWILEERLGSGGFGEVWRARRRHVDLFRALKLMPVVDEDAFAAWRHEISRLEALSHPNIVRFYDADIVAEDGPYQDFAWIATELCDRSLADELDRRPDHRLTPPEAMGVLDAMLSALAAAHAQGCVHRDVKPANILLHGSGVWKLCDFGTARLIPDGETAPRTAVIGTFPYMSPAAHRGRQDQAADLYALGVTVHEALCGERLHPRPPGTTDSEYVKQILDTPPAISPRLDPRWRGYVTALIGQDGPHSAEQLLTWLRHDPDALTAAEAPGSAAAPVAPTRPAAPTPATPRHRTEPPRSGSGSRPTPSGRHRSEPQQGREEPAHLGLIFVLIFASLGVAGLLLHSLIGNPLILVGIMATVLLSMVVILFVS